jgi:hypothetical protein
VGSVSRSFPYAVCALRCLGKTIEGSGIDEAWVEVEVYSSVTVDQIINGNHYRRALEAHEVTQVPSAVRPLN